MTASVPLGLPSFNEALRVWARIGCLSFGGPAAQIALMQREVVDQRNWVSDRRFLHALNFCMLLPGPEAMQLATYLGWLMHGVKGGIAAGLLFILPGAAVMLALSFLYATLGDVPLIAALFFGLKCAVLILVVLSPPAPCGWLRPAGCVTRDGQQMASSGTNLPPKPIPTRRCYARTSRASGPVRCW